MAAGKRWEHAGWGLGARDAESERESAAREALDSTGRWSARERLRCQAHARVRHWFQRVLVRRWQMVANVDGGR